MNYVNGPTACERLGVHISTLYKWDANGKIDTIRTPGNHRMFNVDKYINDRNQDKIPKETNEYTLLDIPIDAPNNRLKIIYCRVSSLSQKDDLQRQKTLLTNKYQKHLLIEDIGSGMNMNRRGFRKMIDWIIEGKVEEVVVAHKVRLARFGFDLFEDLLKKYSNGKIIFTESKKEKEPEAELVEDVLQIMHIFVAKMNGLRKYSVKS